MDIKTKKKKKKKGDTVIIVSHKILVCERPGKSSNGENNIVIVG